MTNEDGQSGLDTYFLSQSESLADQGFDCLQN
jgi:hypothetical protein